MSQMPTDLAESMGARAFDGRKGDDKSMAGRKRMDGRNGGPDIATSCPVCRRVGVWPEARERAGGRVSRMPRCGPLRRRGRRKTQGTTGGPGMQAYRTKKSGFTLVEILIVVI